MQLALAITQVSIPSAELDVLRVAIKNAYQISWYSYSAIRAS